MVNSVIPENMYVYMYTSSRCVVCMYMQYIRNERGFSTVFYSLPILWFPVRTADQLACCLSYSKTRLLLSLESDITYVFSLGHNIGTFFLHFLRCSTVFICLDVQVSLSQPFSASFLTCSNEKTLCKLQYLGILN